MAKDYVKKIQPKEEIQYKKYKCTCCGQSWDSGEKHFRRSRSKIYEANDGYVHICIDCTLKYFDEKVEACGGDEQMAIENMCGIFDWFFLADCYNYSKTHSSSNQNLISNYASRSTLSNITRIGTSYIDTLIGKEYASQGGLVVVDMKKDKNKQYEKRDNTVSIERWGGTGFSDEDYRILDDHYDMLKKSNPNCDSNQEMFILSLCHLNLLRVKSLMDKDSKSYNATNKEYTATFKQAGLKAGVDSDKNIDDCWGLFMELISQHTPEEYYKDKKLYEDFDGIGEQFKRFVLRPLDNLKNKKATRDEEFKVDGD